MRCRATREPETVLLHQLTLGTRLGGQGREWWWVREAGGGMQTDVVLVNQSACSGAAETSNTSSQQGCQPFVVLDRPRLTKGTAMQDHGPSPCVNTSTELSWGGACCVESELFSLEASG